MRERIQVLRQENQFNDELGTWEHTYVPFLTIRCRVRTIYREQLETVVSGANTLRDRKEFECRYTTKITSEHRILYQGKEYQVSIVGDTVGNNRRTRFLAERLDDGGA